MNTALKFLAQKARAVRESDETPVPSPCQSICRIDDTRGLCEGCLRTLDEIATWSRLDSDERRAVWRLIERRLAAPSDA